MSIRILEDRFELEEELTHTDVSTVYLGCDRQHFQRPQCLITGIHYRQAEMRYRLEREAQVLERLGRSPQVPRLLAYAHESALRGSNFGTKSSDKTAKNVFYLVQEHIAGHPISHEIGQNNQNKQLSESYVTKLLQDVLSALSFIHNQGIVHQNLHPEHLIRQDFDGQIFLTQFGSLSRLARSEINDTGELHITAPVIPHPYLAPEQLQPDYERNPQPASDLYALGLIAIEALAGHPHYHFSHAPVVGLNWRENLDVSLPLAEFIDRLIRQDWRDRFADAQTALDTLSLASERYQIAHNSRLPTVMAAPGRRSAKRSYSGGSSLFGSKPLGRSVSKPRHVFRQSKVSTPTNPYLLKIFIGSLAVLIALGVGVKSYQWGQHRLTQLPQSWEDWKTPSEDYPEATASELTPLLDDESILLRPVAADAFWEMVVAAGEEGITLHPLAGYRSRAELEKAADAESTSEEAGTGEEETERSSVPEEIALSDYPTGYAIDIGGSEPWTDRSVDFAQTDAYLWLQENAASFGFELSNAKQELTGLSSQEPWHWRFVDDDDSQSIFG